MKGFCYCSDRSPSLYVGFLFCGLFLFYGCSCILFFFSMKVQEKKTRVEVWVRV